MAKTMIREFKYFIKVTLLYTTVDKFNYFIKIRLL
jgi:hypothetical protein